MAFLVKTLPNLKEVDTWDGGWFEAKLDGAGSEGPCTLTTKAPFGLNHLGDSTTEVNRQSWFLDFSTVTGVGQQGSRIIYKTKDSHIIGGYEAGTPELALQIAYAFDALRRACNLKRPGKS
jgi:hypothetical protein